MAEHGVSCAEALNAGCYCRTLDPVLLRTHLEADASLSGLAATLHETRPHLFSATVVFVSAMVAERIAAVVEAMERIVAVPAYQVQALANAAEIARLDFGPRGVFMGYDFHLSATGPQLIEINTNAGGALLNAALARAQHECCKAMRGTFDTKQRGSMVPDFFASVLEDWRAQRGDTALRSIAVVDDQPETQYLSAEFALFQQLGARQGYAVSVVDAQALDWRDGKLWYGESSIDLVYNRLTDFYLTDPPHQALRQAYVAGAVVLTPNPRAHALYADKRNLIALSDQTTLTGWGISATDRSLLQAVIPATRLVTADNAEVLWAERRQLFFKPVASYGSKAAYRGDKLTRRVWAEIVGGGFVAQALVTPSERLIELDGVLTELKFDVRAYAYAGRVQLLAARMYRGQTTNFRTPGGGFAPVVVCD